MSNDPFSDLDRTGAPIDAQFEPAPAQTGAASLRSGGPGWIALAATGLAAALIGAVTGIYGADILRLENNLTKPKFVKVNIFNNAVHFEEVKFDSIKKWGTCYWSRATSAWHNWMGVEPLKGKND